MYLTDVLARINDHLRIEARRAAASQVARTARRRRRIGLNISTSTVALTCYAAGVGAFESLLPRFRGSVCESLRNPFALLPELDPKPSSKGSGYPPTTPALSASERVSVSHPLRIGLCRS